MYVISWVKRTRNPEISRMKTDDMEKGGWRLDEKTATNKSLKLTAVLWDMPIY